MPRSPPPAAIFGFAAILFLRHGVGSPLPEGAFKMPPRCEVIAVFATHKAVFVRFAKDSSDVYTAMPIFSLGSE